MLGFNGFSPCPMFDMQSVCVPMVMALGLEISLGVWGLSGGVSVWFSYDIVLLLGPRNLLIMFCSNVLMFGLFLVQTFTKSELIERDCFVLRNWLKAFCFARFRSLVLLRHRVLIYLPQSNWMKFCLLFLA